MLKNVAKNVVTSPSCNMNRWADNHYALDIFDGSFDYIVDYVDANSSVLYQCADFGVTGLHYIYDPTGCISSPPHSPRCGLFRHSSCHRASLSVSQVGGAAQHELQ